MALGYLMKAKKIISKMKLVEPDTIHISAQTVLNISSLYTELRRYKEAV